MPFYSHDFSDTTSSYQSINLSTTWWVALMGKTEAAARYGKGSTRGQYFLNSAGIADLESIVYEAMTAIS